MNYQYRIGDWVDLYVTNTIPPYAIYSIQELPPGGSLKYWKIVSFEILACNYKYNECLISLPFEDYLYVEKYTDEYNDILYHFKLKDTKYNVWSVQFCSIIGLTKKNNAILQCKNCNIINEFAISNQSDGSYFCYNCRN